MKQVKVVAAVICSSLSCKKTVLATARGYGEYKGFWEFPGGKVEVGESEQQALMREIKEELDAEILVGDFIQTIEYDYPDFHLSMDCFWCEMKNPSFYAKEAMETRWLNKDDLWDVDWLPADLLVLPAIEAEME